MISFLLVGGSFSSSTRGGFWASDLLDPSVAGGAIHGARLLIKNRDLVCMFRSFIFVTLLSAVIGTSILAQACGVIL